MRVGTVCYAHNRGLGYLAKAFYDHGLVTDVFVIRHPNIPHREDWYPGKPRTPIGRPDVAALKAFCAEQDVMFFWETPFVWELVEHCCDVGVKTVLSPMYECFPKAHHHPFDLYVCPSLLDMEYFAEGGTFAGGTRPDWFGTQGVYHDGCFGGQALFLPIPVEQPWKLRTEARHFVHNGGYLGMRGREGTTLLIDALKYVKSDLKLTIRVQENVKEPWLSRAKSNPRVTYVAETVPYEELYATADVAVAPQKFNGCSLPLQEAFASGLCVCSTDRFPMNTWLPRGPLIPVAGYQRAAIGGAYLEFDEAQLDPRAIAATLDRLYGTCIESYSLEGRRWAEANSWAVLGPQYREALERLC